MINDNKFILDDLKDLYITLSWIKFIYNDNNINGDEQDKIYKMNEELQEIINNYIKNYKIKKHDIIKVLETIVNFHGITEILEDMKKA